MLSEKVDVAFEEKKLMEGSKYTKELGTAIEDKVNPETVIYLLKNQLVDAGIINHNLRRVISMLIWKLNLDKTTMSVKAEIGSSLQKTVDALEGLLKESSERDDTWRHRAEKLDFDIAQLKQQLAGKRVPHGPSGSFLFRPKIKKSVNRKMNRRQDACECSVRHLPCNDSSPVLHPPPKRLLSNQNLASKFSDAYRAKAEVDDKPQVIMVDEAGLTPDSGSNAGSRRHAELEDVTSPMRFSRVTVEGKDTNYCAELENSLKEAQIEQRWHKTLSDLLMDELLKCREQIKMLRDEVSKTESSAEKAIKDESLNWGNVTSNLKVSDRGEI